MKEYIGIVYIVDSLNHNIYDYKDVLMSVENPKVVGKWVNNKPEIS
jgi:hypothetical protein